MKNSSLFRTTIQLVAIITLCLTFSCQNVEKSGEEIGAKTLSDEDVAAIKAIGPALDQAALAGDYIVLTELFTEDTTLMGPNSPTIQGRSALMELLESSGMTILEHKVRFVEVGGYGDLAYAIYTWNETFRYEGEEPVKEEGKILGILRKQSNGSWLIAKWSWNSNLLLSDK